MKQIQLPKVLPILVISLLITCLPSLVSSGEVRTTIKTYQEPSIGIELIRVDGGCYKMGCSEEMEVDYCDSNAMPAHQVCVDSFWMGKFEVTQGQWENVMGYNPSDYKGGDNNPVEMISWNDIQVFLEKLNSVSSGTLHFRLPTEAEWEYAARSGGKDEIYAGGNSQGEDLWHQYDRDTVTVKGIQTWPVGEKKPNGLGLYDMSGNVSEWTSDLYRVNYSTDTPKTNPPEDVRGKIRVFRGGSYTDFPRRKRTTWRDDYPETSTGNDIGFRLAADNK